ncbi:MAG TPA: hypothetical protein VFD82_11770 [Planctomycetota bacterium]|nr:hypothetical protein [Planctomycetota bacterium]
MTSERWFRRFLSLCPVLIGLSWIAGTVHFHQYALMPREWAVLAAAAFALHLMWLRLRRQRPVPPLPEGANPAALAALAASILGTLVAIFGGVMEWIVQPYLPSETSLWLRAIWHGACAFAASYCALLLPMTGTKAPAKR